MFGKVKLTTLLIGAFILLSPLSLAPGFAGVYAAKYLRLATSVLIVVVGLASSGARVGKASKAMLVFAGLWLASATWSDLPHWALFHKGMFVLTLASGIAFGAAVRRLSDVQRDLRFLGVIAGIACLTVLAVYLRDPSTAIRQDRLVVLGINANLMAQAVVPLTVFCTFLAITEQNRGWKWYSVVSLLAAFTVLILTGSRGGVATALLGCGILLIPHGKKPAIVIMSLGLLLTIGYLTVDVLAPAESLRLLDEVVKDTRSGIWRFAFRRFEESPAIGKGWLHVGNQWVSVIGTYPQVLAEAGSIGILVLFTVMIVIARQWFVAQRRVRSSSSGTTYVFLAGAMIAAPLVHGLAESSTVMGTSSNPLLLGMGLSLLDCLPRCVARDGNSVSRRRRLLTAATLAHQERTGRSVVVVGLPHPHMERDSTVDCELARPRPEWC